MNQFSLALPLILKTHCCALQFELEPEALQQVLQGCLVARGPSFHRKPNLRSQDEMCQICEKAC